MLFIALVVMLAIGGACIGVIGGYLAGGPFGLMTGFMSGILPFLGIMMMVGKAKTKGFLIRYRDLKRNLKEGWYEKYIDIPDKFGKLHTFIGKVKEAGLVTIKGIGKLDDKGDEYSYGTDPQSFALPNKGLTIDFEKAHQLNMVAAKYDVDNYEDAVKHYLGEQKYKIFYKLFRSKHFKDVDIDDINNEIAYLVHQEHPADPMTTNTLGETIGIRSLIGWLAWVCNPVYIEGSIASEKLYTKQLERQMKLDRGEKWTGLGKMVVYILIGLMIFLLAVGSMWPSISPMFEGLLGG